MRNLRQMFNHGRLAGTGYMSILPVDQGIEHSAAASFAPNPIYFDPAASSSSRSRAAVTPLPRPSACSAPSAQVRAPDPVHRQAQPQRAADLPEPLRPDHVRSVQRAWEHGAAGVGATIYFGSDQSTRQIREVSEAFEEAHELGHVHGPVVLPAQPGVQAGRVDYHASADLTGQANHLGVTIQADIIKQKAAREQQRLRRRQRRRRVLRQDLQARLQRALKRPPDRPHPLPGAQLLQRPRAA